MKPNRKKIYLFLALELALLITAPVLAIVPICAVFLWALTKAINEGAPN